MFYLKPPRHISTLPKTEVAALRRDVCFAPDSVEKVLLPKVPKILKATGAVFV